LEASTHGLQILGDAIDAFYRRDSGKANEAIELSAAMPDEQLTQSILTLKGNAVVPMAYIAESIHRIASYAVDIGEIALDSSYGRAHSVRS
jgi:phosphate uptake regulator